MFRNIPQQADRKAFARLLARGVLEWQDGRLVPHPILAYVQPNDPTTPQPWGKNYDAHLLRMIRRGVTIRRIGIHFRRSAPFLEGRLAQLRKKQSKPHWTPHRLSDLPAGKIRAAIIASGTWTVAGEKLGFRWTSVRDWGRRHGVALGKPRVFKRLRTPARMVRLLHIRKLIKASYSQREIADRFGVSVQVINRAMHSAEYKRLP